MAFVALYVGQTVESARLVAATADADLVRAVAETLRRADDQAREALALPASGGCHAD